MGCESLVDIKVKTRGPNGWFGCCPQSEVEQAFFSIRFRRSSYTGTKQRGTFPHNQETDDDNDDLKFGNFPQG